MKRPVTRNYIAFWGCLVMANVVASGPGIAAHNAIVIAVFLVLAAVSLWADYHD